MTDGERPSRHRPAHQPVVELGHQAILMFVTVCTKDRRPVLANPHVHAVLLAAWANACDWRVGRYVIMPDHVHFFCAPGRLDYPALSKWMAYWKSLVVRKEKGFGPLAGPHGPGGTEPSKDIVSGETAFTPSGSEGPGRTGPSMGKYGPALVWQRDFWDRQLRSGESCGEKWAYVRANPVRAGLVERPEDWPFQGEMCELRWHDA